MTMKNKEIGISAIWAKEKRDALKDFISTHAQKQSRERKLKNELLAIQYQIEDYITADAVKEKMHILDFVKLYLKTFNVTQKNVAQLFEMSSGNLHKYLVGDRKLNTDMLLKLSSFSHLKPEYWLRIEIKNELMDISKEQHRNKKYEKYDYRHLLAAELQ